jgi:prepilin-type N-terminal cleavage/methylation domain-containing protein
VRQRLRAARQNQNGFTLTELLIVIVILGVLAGIVVFAVGGITDKGVAAACQADKRTVITAVEAYRAQKGSFPTAGSSDANYALLTAAPQYLREKPNGGGKYTVTLADGGVVTGAILEGTGTC